MDTTSLSRRDALRLAGATFGAAAVGAPASGMFSAADAAPRRRRRRWVRTVLDKRIYQPGEVMRLTVTDNLVRRRTTRISDSRGHNWRKVFDNGRRQVWHARATQGGEAVVVCRLTRAASRRTGRTRTFTDRVGYRVADVPVNPPDNPGPTDPPVTKAKIIGMSSPAHLWTQRVAEVGVAGLGARRIFADLRAGADDQMRLVEQAHAAGLMPVISYKVGGDAAGAAAGKFNAVAEKAAERLASFGLPTTVTYWHEPHGNMAPAQFVAGNKQLLPIFKRGQLKVGPLLNGWLLDRNVSTFTSYCPDELFELWDWFGIDTYESGTMQFPGPIKPAHRIPKLAAYVASRGFDHPLGIGEYNGYSAKSISDAGDAILSEPKVWFGCMWNSTTGKGYTLTGDRLQAFKQTLADPRTLRVA